ncbi:thiol-disulfide isomerase/thioredoxin [Dysgonomonadaceae bacterium PH5-43]|nr:thiol-disulfide isomerase/thioredoxin [Dysgonomonadaceae bacterium PH5-43]
MKNTIIFIVATILLASCAKSPQDYNATFSGKIINLSDEVLSDSSITVIVECPILNKDRLIRYYASINADGTFSVEIPLITDVLGRVFTPYNVLGVLLKPGEEVVVEITKQTGDSINKKTIKGAILTDEEELEMSRLDNIMAENMMEGVNREELPSDATPYDIVANEVRRAKKDISCIKESTVLSDWIKEDWYNIKLLWYCNSFIINELEPHLFDKSIYFFLKELNLNSPSAFNTGLYSEFLQVLLNDKILAIPSIGDTPIETWIAEVKPILADLVGFEEGAFYDCLAANAYTNQMVDKLEPLSDIQKDNIKAYFKNPHYATLLFDFSDKTEKSLDVVSITPPDVPTEELMNAIVEKYKGNVVFIDFWATWCGPCLNAMAASQSLKESLKDEDITFVYIADYSSIESVWRKQVVEVEGGEHYYLNPKDRQYIYNALGASGFPFYVIYDKEGNLIHKFTGYPGNDVVKKVIEGLL